MTDQYKKSGVDIDTGNRFIDLIKPLINKTKRRGVITDIGGFGGLFSLDCREFKEPILVAATDGVGTKLKLAIELKRYDTIGIDLVAMCVNDIVCCGAKPLFFLDYFATGRLNPEEHKDVVQGIAEGCLQTACALIGGETAEMPDMYAPDDFDLAGFAVGIIDKNKIIDGTEVRLGHSIIGLASSGFHANGYSLIRKIIKEHNLDIRQSVGDLDKPLGELLLEPTKLYSPLLLRLLQEHKVNAIAHITGGGFWENIPRVLPLGVQAHIEKDSWPFPPLMSYFQNLANINDAEMFRVFNCGLGMVIIVPEEQAQDICDLINAHGEAAYVIGSVQSKSNNEQAVVIE